MIEHTTSGPEVSVGEALDGHRRELHRHCYRMLGSAHDADDAVQETMLRAWRALPDFAGRSSVRTWLYTIATNVCLNRLERRPPAPVPFDPDDPSGGPVRVDPYADDGDGPPHSGAARPPGAAYDQLESVELAFIAATRLLPPTQRAVLLLRDVLGFSARETAAALDTSEASVTSSLQRARVTLRRRLPARSQQANLRSLGDTALQRLVDAYVDAWRRHDVAALVALLAEDAVFSMPPAAISYRGRAAISSFLPTPMGLRWSLVPTRVNGQLAFGCYLWDDDRDLFVAHSVDVVTLDRGAIGAITAFIDPEWIARLGLPSIVTATRGHPAR